MTAATLDRCLWQTLILTGMLALCLIAVWWTEGAEATVLTAMTASFLLPVLIAAVWITALPLIRSLIRQPWAIFAGSCIALVWGILARSQASTLLNEIFRIDPGYFPLTGTFLMAASFLMWIALPVTCLVLALLFVTVAPMMLWLWSEGSGAQKALRTGGLAVLVLTAGFFATLVLHLSRDIRPVAEWVALNTDFSPHHLCTAPWDSPAERVIFLSHGDVLARLPQAGAYEIRPCYLRAAPPAG